MISKEEKIKKILDAINLKGLTAYELAKNTGLNESGLNRFIKREIVNPHKTTIAVLYDYLYSNNTVEVKKEGNLESRVELLESKVENQKETIDSLKERIKMIYDQLLFFQNSWIAAEKNKDKKSG